MERTDESVDAFIEGNDDDGTLAAIDRVIVDALAGAARTLWRGVFWGGTEQAIIGYGDITQPRPRGADVEWFLIGLARQQEYVSLYVNAADGRQYLSKEYGPRLGKTKVGAAAISFRTIDDIDVTVLAELARHAGRVQSYR